MAVAPTPAHGMDAGDPDEPASPRGSVEYLAPDALCDRLEEEVNRAGRHGTALCCLLVDVEDLRDVRRAYGERLAAQALAYVELALRCELRRFDRVGPAGAGELLLIVLPGADAARGEVVARRLLVRLRALKLESGGVRRPLRFAVGLASWRAGMSAAALLDALRAAGVGRAGAGAPRWQGGAGPAR
jgi:GGDEF domain-containing protein